MNIKELPAKSKEQKILRVAAYTRVSAEMETKLHSLTAQEDYYREYIAAHSEWEFAGVYSDYGIPGTTIQRPEFQRMLEDCRAGKIDLIITKSVTRFARNTVILLNTIRELKALGVDTYFEKENMHGISPDGELLITLLAMYAEEEARSASENQKWRIQKLYAQGKAAGGHIFGYRLVDGKFEIVPEEAEIVKMIFDLYLSGMGYGKIARTLIERGVDSRFGSWSSNSVRDVLLNEKYAGNMLLQKFFVEDFRTKKLRKNTGELRRVYVENCHEPIIDRQTFDAVQAEIARRGHHQIMVMEHRNIAHNNREKLFTGQIICGNCGCTFLRKYTNAKAGDRPVWICQKNFRYGKSACASQRIPEMILIEKTCEVLGMSEISRELIAEKICRILVPEHNRLIFELRDGSTADVTWEHPSRSLSWTDEMRQAAREKAIKQRKEK